MQQRLTELYEKIATIFGHSKIGGELLPELDPDIFHLLVTNAEKLTDYLPFKILAKLGSARQGRIDSELTDLNGKIDRLMGRLDDLPKGSRAREKTLADIAEVESEIERLTKEREPIEFNFQQMLIRHQRLIADLRIARNNAKGSSARERAEALGRIVSTIVCHFAPNPDWKGQNAIPRSLLVKVDFVTIDGRSTEAYTHPQEAELTKQP